MSTRSQIRFKEKGDQSTQIYKHSDGYPEGQGGVVSELYEFFANYYMKDPQARFGDPSYAAADFIYWEKEKSRKSLGKQFEKSGYEKIGEGVQNRGMTSGSEEYLYTVTMKNQEPNNPNSRSYIINLKIQQPKFYDEKGFKNGKVIFEGTLIDAYRKYVAKEEEKEKKLVKV